MSVLEMLQSVRFVVDAQGQKAAVLVDLAIWEEILTLLEDLEDIEEIRQAREQEAETIPWQQVKVDLGLGA